MLSHLTNCDCDLCRMCVQPVTLTTTMIPVRGLIIPAAMPQHPLVKPCVESAALEAHTVVLTQLQWQFGKEQLHG